MKYTNINNRRYLGNKYRLFPFIKKIIANECGDFDTFADIFAGTGAVSSAFIDKTLITNDILYSNHLCHITWFLNSEFDSKKIEQYIEFYNSDILFEENYMTENFSDTFFSKSVCSKIGFIREHIEQEYKNHNLNNKEYAMLVTSLLYAMDKIANTCGHYDAFRKDYNFNNNLVMSVPTPNNNLCNNSCYNLDANELVKSISSDVIYIDPPYNSRQYCDAYHLIENVARWEKPKVFGIARKMDRTKLKSKYCTTKASKAFESLIDCIKAKYIVVSYNNMAKKGNERSNARISDKELTSSLKKRGEVKVFSKKFKAVTTGRSEYYDNEERIFLCKCK